MIEFDKKEKLESKLKYLEEILKHFNRNQTFNLLLGALTFYVGKQIDQHLLKYVGCIGFGITTINALVYPGLCKDYNLIKETLEDKIDYDN